MKNKKGLLWNEIIVLVVVVIIFLAVAPAIFRIVSSVLFNKNPEDTATVDSFNNLIKEIKKLEENKSPYAFTESVPFYLGEKFAVFAYNSNDNEIKFFVNNNLIKPQKTLLPFKRPAKCKDTCICLAKEKIDNLDCRSFSSEIFIFGMNDVPFLGDSFLSEGSNYISSNFGQDINTLSFFPFEDPDLFNVYLTKEKRTNYAYFLFLGKKPADSFDDPNKNLYKLKTRQLYIDKLDLTLLKDEKFLNNGTQKHIFIALGRINLSDDPEYGRKFLFGSKEYATDDLTIQGKNILVEHRKKILKPFMLRDPVKTADSILTSTKDYEKIYHFLSYFRYLKNPHLFNQSDQNTLDSEISYLGIDALRQVRDSIYSRILECSKIENQDEKNKCFESYVNDCNSLKDFVEECKEILSLNISQYKQNYVRSIEDFKPENLYSRLNKIILRNLPDEESLLILREAKIKEELGQYDKAILIYMDYFKKNSDIFYDKNGNFNFSALKEEKYRKFSFLEKMLYFIDAEKSANFANKIFVSRQGDNDVEINISFIDAKQKYIFNLNSGIISLVEINYEDFNLMNNDIKELNSQIQGFHQIKYNALISKDKLYNEDKSDLYLALVILDFIKQKECIDYSIYASSQNKKIEVISKYYSPKCQKYFIYKNSIQTNNQPTVSAIS